MARQEPTGQFVNIIGQGTRLNGDITFEEDVLIDGRVEGKIEVKGRLVLGENAQVIADAVAREMEIRGQVKGNISCTEHLRLAPTARLVGDVQCGLLSVEEGATLQGKITMATGSEAAATSQSEPKSTAHK